MCADITQLCWRDWVIVEQLSLNCSLILKKRSCFLFLLSSFHPDSSVSRNICFKFSQINGFECWWSHKNNRWWKYILKIQETFFYSFTIGGCKLGFQTCLPAVTHPVSKFLQLAATHKNTCLVQTVQSRENIYLQKHDGKHSNRVQDKLYLWVLYKYVWMQKLWLVNDKHKKIHKMCANVYEKQQESKMTKEEKVWMQGSCVCLHLH